MKSTNVARNAAIGVKKSVKILAERARQMPRGRVVGQEAWKAVNQDVLLDPTCCNCSEMSTGNKNQIALLIINHFFPPKITSLPLPEPLNH